MATNYMTKNENAFAIRENQKMYLSVQENSDGDWDYSVYNAAGELIDGGVLDATDGGDIYEAAEEIVRMYPSLFGMTPEIDEVDYDDLMDFVN